MMSFARTLGAICGHTFYFLVKIERALRRQFALVPVSLGVLFGLAVAFMPANTCPKLLHRARRMYRITQPNREHKRANERGTLAL